MRNIITFTVIAISLFATSCSKKRTWLEESGMKGCIISFTDTVWYASDKFGEVHKEWIENYTKVDLNEDGQITAITKYDKDGDIQEKTVQEWKDKYTISSVTYYKEDGNASSKETFKFNGDKVSSIQVDDYMDNSEEKLTYEYDKDRVTKIIGSKKGKKKSLPSYTLVKMIVISKCFLIMMVPSLKVQVILTLIKNLLNGLLMVTNTHINMIKMDY